MTARHYRDRYHYRFPLLAPVRLFGFPDAPYFRILLFFNSNSVDPPCSGFAQPILSALFVFILFFFTRLVGTYFACSSEATPGAELPASPVSHSSVLRFFLYIYFFRSILPSLMPYPVAGSSAPRDLSNSASHINSGSASQPSAGRSPSSGMLTVHTKQSAYVCVLHYRRQACRSISRLCSVYGESGVAFR